MYKDEVEYSGGIYFACYAWHYMGLCPQRESSSNIKKQDISMVPAGYIQRDIDEYSVNNYDLSV